jgi:hypothetical protein
MVSVFALLLAANPTTPARAAVQEVVEHLDMTSFPNSLGPARGKGKRTLRQFGRQRFAWNDGTLEVTEADGGWIRTFAPLPSLVGRIRLCFVDQAQNGGTYLTRQAIELVRGAGGLYRAHVVKDRACEAYLR